MSCRTAPRQAPSGVRSERVRITVKSIAACAVVAVLGVAADAVSKEWATSRLSGGRSITVPGGWLRLQLVINHGASFGLGAGDEPLLAAAAFAGVILLGAWAVRAVGWGGGGAGTRRRGQRLGPYRGTGALTRLRPEGQTGLTACMCSTVPALRRSVSTIWNPAARIRGS
jgi:hypothetical protein